jgi:hypothetical protein
MDPFEDRVHIVIHRAVMDSIFAECDRYDDHETGGRLIGTYKAGPKGALSITVSGVIEAGPRASRTATSFFQDGSHQEKVFRRLEADHPEIEHLGNWHTHHMNGYPTLSGGDRETYHRVVNHRNHNTDFFYALLVTARNDSRYAVKHFIVYRHDPKEYEIAPSHVDVVEGPVLWPASLRVERDAPAQRKETIPDLADQRARDGQFFREFQPAMQAYLSKKDGSIYWRGKIALVDDSSPEILVTEVREDRTVRYRVCMIEESPRSIQPSRGTVRTHFASAREAVVVLERELNRELFRITRKEKREVSDHRHRVSKSDEEREGR